MKNFFKLLILLAFSCICLIRTLKKEVEYLETKELAELVRKAQRGDKQAQQEIYLDSSKAVYFLALKILRNKNDEEDITQDVFITVYEKLAGLKQPGAYYKWVNQITANACLMLIRKKKPIPIDEPDVLDALDFEDEGDAPTPEKLFDDEETRRLIMEIIDALPDSQRICVMYRYFNQLSIEEIAAKYCDQYENSFYLFIFLVGWKVCLC